MKKYNTPTNILIDILSIFIDILKQLCADIYFLFDWNGRDLLVNYQTSLYKTQQAGVKINGKYSLNVS